jgi:hypothetical protein
MMSRLESGAVDSHLFQDIRLERLRPENEYRKKKRKIKRGGE